MRLLIARTLCLFEMMIQASIEHLMATGRQDLAKAGMSAARLSYSKYSCDYNGIKASQTVFIPIADPVELWML